MIWAIIVGLIVGAIAKLLVPGKDAGGCLTTALLGIAGGLIAALLGQSLGIYRPGEPAGFIASIIGAVILLLIFRMLRGGRPSPPA